MSSAVEINLDNYLCIAVTSTTVGTFGGLLVGFNTYGYVYEEAQYIIVDSMDETATNPQWKTLPSDGSTVQVNIGKKMVVKAKLHATTTSGVGKFTMSAIGTTSARCSLRGNCMSLLYGDNAEGETSVDQSSFSSLFNGCTLISGVSSTFLPATTLGVGCYMGTFSGCTNLTSAPDLPALTLAPMCYYSMFSGCTSLQTAPTLPASTPAARCYSNMYYGCTSLSYIKVMLQGSFGGTDDYYTEGWVYGVHTGEGAGTFVKHTSAVWTSDEINYAGMPYGWAVQNATS